MRCRWAVFALALPALAQSVPGFSTGVNLVRVPCVVTDATGLPAAGLRQEDFAVFEDGARQEIKYLWREADLPLTIGLVVDISGSQQRFVEEHHESVLRFLRQVISERDRAFLVRVEIQQRLVTDLTNSIERLRAGVEALRTEGPKILGDPCPTTKRRFLFTSFIDTCASPIWNGIFYAARLKLRPEPSRKAILLLSDGWDMGSQHTLEEAIEACQRADTMVYSIRYFDLAFAIDREILEALERSGMSRKSLERYSRRHTKALERRSKVTRRNLERLSTQTGGRLYEGDSANVAAIFESIEAELRTQYVIGYTHTKAPKTGYHKIKVRVNRPGLIVRARAGYHAGEPLTDTPRPKPLN